MCHLASMSEQYTNVRVVQWTMKNKLWNACCMKTNWHGMIFFICHDQTSHALGVHQHTLWTATANLLLHHWSPLYWQPGCPCVHRRWIIWLFNQTSILDRLIIMIMYQQVGVTLFNPYDQKQRGVMLPMFDESSVFTPCPPCLGLARCPSQLKDSCPMFLCWHGGRKMGEPSLYYIKLAFT